MLLEKLSAACGVSGCEGEVRRILREELSLRADRLETDVMGNLLVYREGRAKSPRLLVSAHMDEVGMMVVDIDKSGLLRFKKVGGIADEVLPAKAVLVGPQKVRGVIGAKAIHLQKKEEREKALKGEQLYIDIGAADEEEAGKRVSPGDYVCFAAQPQFVGEDGFMGKALDDRAGCFVLAELFKEELPISLYGAFTVQEEVGLRGAGVAAYALQPHLALVVEVTRALDVIDNKEHLYSTTLGKGPALTLMDSTFMAHKKLLDFLVQRAEENGIPYQFRSFTGAGTDAGRISLTAGGVPSAVISIPCRYLHSPNSLINMKDLEGVKELLRVTMQSLAKGGFEEWKT